MVSRTTWTALCLTLTVGLVAQELDAFQNGLIQYTTMDLDEAIVSLYDAVAADPSDPKVWYYRGATREAIGEHSGALDDLNKAVKLSPDNLTFLLKRADILKGINQRQRAINDLERVVYLSPTGPIAVQALLELGQMHLEGNSYKEAAVTFNQLVMLSPEDPASHYYRGLSLSHVGEHEKAILDYSNALLLDDHYYEAYEARAIQLVLLGNMTEACADLYMSKELGSLYANDLIESFCN